MQKKKTVTVKKIVKNERIQRYITFSFWFRVSFSSSNFFGLITRPDRLVFSSLGVPLGVLGGVAATIGVLVLLSLVTGVLIFGCLLATGVLIFACLAAGVTAGESSAAALRLAPFLADVVFVLVMGAGIVYLMVFA